MSALRSKSIPWGLLEISLDKRQAEGCSSSARKCDIGLVAARGLAGIFLSGACLQKSARHAQEDSPLTRMEA